MDEFLCPNGEWVSMDDVAFYCDAMTHHEALRYIVGEIMWEHGQSGLPSWWKQRYRGVIIEVAIEDAYVLSCGVQYDPIHDQWHASKDVPVGRAWFEEKNHDRIRVS